MKFVDGAIVRSLFADDTDATAQIMREITYAVRNSSRDGLRAAVSEYLTNRCMHCANVVAQMQADDSE